MASSAADHVFGITELLEKVLLSIESSHLDQDHNQDYNDGSPIVIQLFALQRVSRTFAITIRGSKELLKRMLLESPNATTRGHPFRPLGWFTATHTHPVKMRNYQVASRYLGSPLGSLVKVWAPVQTEGAVGSVKSIKRNESWRKIPILDYDLCRPTTLAFLVEWSPEPNKTAVYKVAWRLDYDSRLTLGDFHDFCVELMGRDKAQHLKSRVGSFYVTPFDEPDEDPNAGEA